MSNTEIARAVVRGFRYGNQAVLEALGVPPTQAQVLFAGLKAMDDDGVICSFNRVAKKKVTNPSPHINELRKAGLVKGAGKRGDWVPTEKLVRKLESLVGQTKQKPRHKSKNRKEAAENAFNLLDFLQKNANPEGKIVIKRSLIAAAAEHMGSKDAVRKGITALKKSGSIVEVPYRGRVSAYTIAQGVKAASTAAVNHHDPLAGLRGVTGKTTLNELADMVAEQNEADNQEILKLQRRIEEIRAGQEQRATFLKQLLR